MTSAACSRPGQPLDTLTHALARAAEAAPDRTFVEIDRVPYSFADIDRRSTRFAHSLLSHGVGIGDRVVTLLETSVDVLMCWLACSKIRSIWVPINLAYRGQYLLHQLNDSEPKVIVCDSGYVERVTDLADQFSSRPLIFQRGGEVRDKAGVGITPLDEVRGTDDSPIPCISEPGDTAAIIYTSGTTGPSKGCMLSQNLFCHLGQQHVSSVLHGPDEKSFTCLPLFHIAALYPVLSALLTRTSVAIASRFSVSSFWDDVEYSGATNAVVIGSILPLVAHAPDTEASKRCYGRLHTVTGVPIPPEIRRIWHERFGVSRLNSHTYGQTEGSKLSFARPEDPPPPNDSAGPIAEEFDVRIFDDEDRQLPDGEVGEIVWRPLRPHIGFQGYWRRPEDTVKVWRNLWMHTGDFGRIENGYLYFTDRKKDYLRSRGENISSFELEASFATHPGVMDIAVHAVGASAGEDEIKATCVLTPDAQVTHEELCRWAIDNLPYFAVPRYFEFRSELPRNPTGKILKYALREDGVTASTWDREAAGIVVRRR